MGKLKLYFVLVILAIVFSTCRKYPDGGWSNRAIAHLGQEGYWKLTLFEVNGIDSTYLIKGLQDNSNFYEQFIKFGILDKRDRVYNATTNLYYYSLTFNKRKTEIDFGSNLNTIGDSSFKNDSTQCFLQTGILKCERNIMNPEKNRSTTWKIEKLTKSEIILAAKLTNTYKVKLVR